MCINSVKPSYEENNWEAEFLAKVSDEQVTEQGGETPVGGPRTPRPVLLVLRGSDQKKGGLL